MSCENEQQLISLLLDRRITGAERENALAHIASCRSCEISYDAMKSHRASLGKMASSPVPAVLEARLRELAAHERLRQLSYLTQHSRLEKCRDTVHLWFDNLMRPMALPFAGGLLSAFLLFSAWVPTMAAPQPRADVPVPIFTAPSLDDRQFTPPDAGGDAVVTLLIDPRGKVMDCKITGGEVSPELINMILFYKYTPATIFGKNTWGVKVFRLHEITVAG